MLNIPSFQLEYALDNYDAFLFDAYGVLVDLVTSLPGAKQMLQQLETQGKPFFVVTNDASKTLENSSKNFAKKGLDVRPEQIISSGNLLLTESVRQQIQGKKCIVLGPQDPIDIVLQAGGEIISYEDNTELEVLIVADETGFDLLQGLDKTLSKLFAQFDAGKEVILLLPNPDLVYPKSHGEFGVASGSIAAIFEQALKRRYNREIRFQRLGKPHSLIYQIAKEKAGSEKLLMFGDQLQTDIIGAKRAGLDTVFVTGGVTNIREHSLSEENRPTFFLDSFETLRES